MNLDERIKYTYGMVFDEWTMEGDSIGRGGSGHVYKAVKNNATFSEEGAIKFINIYDEYISDVEGQLEEINRIKNKAEAEISIMYRLKNCPNTISFIQHKFEIFNDGQRIGCDLIILMGLVESLDKIVGSKKIFTEEEVIQVGKDIANALVTCHKENIMHRDIKPANIFFDGQSYLLGDFGISTFVTEKDLHTKTGSIYYAAPEQFSGVYDERVDIYALGLVLYELANGNRYPFAVYTHKEEEFNNRRLKGEVLPDIQGISDGLQAVIKKACAYNLGQRYTSALELYSALCELSGTISNNTHNNAYANVKDEYATMPAINPYSTSADMTRPAVNTYGNVTSGQLPYMNGNATNNTVNNMGGYNTASNMNAYNTVNNVIGNNAMNRNYTNSQLSNDGVVTSVRKKHSKLPVIFTLCLLLIGGGVFVGVKIQKNHKDKKNQKLYDEAVTLYEDRQYDEAREKFEQIKDDMDVDAYISDIDQIIEYRDELYATGVEQYEKKQYVDAINTLQEIEDYNDSKDYIEKSGNALLEQAQEKIDVKEYDAAMTILDSIPDVVHKESEIESMKMSIDSNKDKDEYELAISYYDQGEYELAQQKFKSLGDYEDSKDYLNKTGECIYSLCEMKYSAGEYNECYRLLQLINENSEWDQYEKAQNKVSSLKDEYKQSVESEAIEILRNDGYEAFCDYVRGKKNDFYDSDGECLISEYKPVSLLGMQTYAEGALSVGTDCNDNAFRDNLGDYYDYGLFYEGYSGSAYVEYKVDGYNFFQGKLIHYFRCRSSEDKGYLLVYGDGELLYKSSPICKGVDPIVFSIDISNVDLLRIEFDGFWNDFGVAEPVFSK